MLPKIEYRLLKRKDLASIAALHGELYPRRKSVSALEWEFFSFSLPQASILIGAFDGNNLVGTQGFIPAVIRYQGNKLLSFKSELTLLKPEYRGKGFLKSMYECGIQFSEEMGAICVWGFTSAIKPLSQAGFKIIGPLYEEYLMLDLLRLVLAKFGYKGNPTELNVKDTIILKEGGIDKDVLYVPSTRERIQYRYFENPWRRVAQIDIDNGCLYSYDPKEPYMIFLSEVADPSRIVESVKIQKNKFRVNWACIYRFSNMPILGWFDGLKGIPLRRESPMKIVFMWLGNCENEPLPKFRIEEGYKEGT